MKAEMVIYRGNPDGGWWYTEGEEGHRAFGCGSGVLRALKIHPTDRSVRKIRITVCDSAMESRFCGIRTHSLVLLQDLHEDSEGIRFMGHGVPDPLLEVFHKLEIGVGMLFSASYEVIERF